MSEKRIDILTAMASEFDKLDDVIAKIEERIDLVKEKQMTAKNEGDLSENQAYHDAVEELQHLQINLKNTDTKREMWGKFKKVAAESAVGTAVVKVGNIVRIKNIRNGESRTFMLVPERLGNAALGAMSVNSKVGVQVQGKQVNDIITITSARYGMIEYKIETIN